ncbi:MAG: Rieske 2Fe-2S domain-containing protein [Pseudomonadota bacterium]
MPESEAGREDAAQWLCAAEVLCEGGRAALFRVWQSQQEVGAFALRFEGRVVAYLNRCQHVPVELDWQPGEFLDSRREVILCAVHGAAYEPHTGRCVGGPCGRGRLTPVQVQEREGQVYWYPSADILPVPDTRA